MMCGLTIPRIPSNHVGSYDHVGRRVLGWTYLGRFSSTPSLHCGGFSYGLGLLLPSCVELGAGLHDVGATTRQNQSATCAEKEWRYL